MGSADHKESTVSMVVVVVGLGLVAAAAFALTIWIDPPDFLGKLTGWLVFALVFMALVVCLLFVAVLIAFLSNPDVEPTEQECARELAELEAIGFARLGPALAMLKPRTVFVPIAHRDLPICGVMRFDHTGTFTGYEIKTRFVGSGELITSNVGFAGFDPIPAGVYLQVFPEAPPATLFHEHLAALRTFGSLTAQSNPEPEAFAHHLRDCAVRQHRVFREAPLRYLAIMFWRSVTRRNPYRAPLADQKISAVLPRARLEKSA